MNKEQTQRIGTTVGIMAVSYLVLWIVAWGYARVLYDIRKKQILTVFPGKPAKDSIYEIGTALSGLLACIFGLALFFDGVLYASRHGHFSSVTLYSAAAIILGGMGCTVFYLGQKVFLFFRSIIIN